MSILTAEKAHYILESRGLLEKVCESCDGDCAHCKVYYKALKEKSNE